jgi:hypothetical protein
MQRLLVYSPYRRISFGTSSCFRSPHSQIPSRQLVVVLPKATLVVAPRILTRRMLVILPEETILAVPPVLVRRMLASHRL